MDRRKFIGSLAALGVGSALLPACASGTPSTEKKNRKRRGRLTVDENLICIVSDLHVRPGYYQQEYFNHTIDEILALNPRPLHVLCLGDIAYLTGRPEEYAAAKQGLDRLEEAGMQVTMAMGNHDRRENFAAAFPEKAAASELSDRLVFTVQTPRTDFILLDSLQEGDNHDKWITEGDIDDAQRAWLEAKLASYTDKPVFVMAHHPLNETKIGKLLMAAPACQGYIYGHLHIWEPGWINMNYHDRTLLRTLCVPSTGHWGDIGFTLLDLGEGQAEASLMLREFFFPNPLNEGESKPELWTELERNNKDAVCVFPYSF